MAKTESGAAYQRSVANYQAYQKSGGSNNVAAAMA